jgi:transposase
MTVAGRYRAGDPLTPTSAAKMALHSIARRWAGLDTEIRPLARDIKTILDSIAAPLLARHGVGFETAGSLLCAAGDNPDRLATEASFAALCGTSPVPVSSGRSNRHTSSAATSASFTESNRPTVVMAKGRRGASAIRSRTRSQRTWRRRTWLLRSREQAQCPPP